MIFPGFSVFCQRPLKEQNKPQWWVILVIYIGDFNAFLPLLSPKEKKKLCLGDLQEGYELEREFRISS